MERAYSGPTPSVYILGKPRLTQAENTALKGQHRCLSSESHTAHFSEPMSPGTIMALMHRKGGAGLQRPELRQAQAHS